MTKYEKQILNVLLDKYEGSKSFIGTNQVNQSFTCKVAQMFPKYKDDSEYELFCAINEAVNTLVAQDFVTAKKLKSGVVQSVTLSLDAINEAYEYLGRIPKSDIVIDCKNVIEYICNYDDSHFLSFSHYGIVKLWEYSYY